MPKRLKRKSHRLAAGIILLVAQQVQAQQVTLSNNLLYDAWLTPNARIGVRLAPQWSAGITAGYRPWPSGDNQSKKWRHLLLSPDIRYWTDSVNVRHFFGLNLLYSHYNVADVKFPFGLYPSVRDERRQGDLGALGVFYGYSWPLGRHWNVEALVGAAVGYAKYTRYACGHCGKKIGDDKKAFAMPQAALNVVYNIPGRPRPVLPVEEPVVVLPQEKPEEPWVFTPVLPQVPEFAGRAGQLQKDNPVLAHISRYKPYDRTQVLRKERGALYVHFPVGKSVLNADFRDNRQTLDRIVDVTRQIMADSTSSVKVIQIVGLASVEGKTSVNERLSCNRAEALKRYVQSLLPVPDSLFDVACGGEAWAEFRDQLADLAADQPGDARLAAAIDVIDNEPDVIARGHRLRQLDGGRTWSYIKQHVLHDQRNSGYVHIYYDHVPDAAAATINQASRLLNEGRPGEALSLLEAVRSDERAQNALGVALWQTGHQEEAMQCFRRAAGAGDRSAADNLRQLEERTGK